MNDRSAKAMFMQAEIFVNTGYTKAKGGTEGGVQPNGISFESFWMG